MAGKNADEPLAASEEVALEKAMEAGLDEFLSDSDSEFPLEAEERNPEGKSAQNEEVSAQTEVEVPHTIHYLNILITDPGILNTYLATLSCNGRSEAVIIHSRARLLDIFSAASQFSDDEAGNKAIEEFIEKRIQITRLINGKQAGSVGKHSFNSIIELVVMDIVEAQVRMERMRVGVRLASMLSLTNCEITEVCTFEPKQVPIYVTIGKDGFLAEMGLIDCQETTPINTQQSQ